MAALDGQAIINKFENMVGDSLDPDFELQLANDAKDQLETELELEITKTLDSSQSTSVSQTASTAVTLPTDFLSPIHAYVDQDRLLPVPFELQREYVNDNGFYWIDLANSAYHLTGTQSLARTIYFFYHKATPDLTLGTSPVWPARFHNLIPLQMAKIYWAIDGGEKNRAWDDRFSLEYRILKDSMVAWDQRLKLNGLDRSAAPISGSTSRENSLDI